MDMKVLHEAIRIIEDGGAEGFTKASALVGVAVALAILTTRLREMERRRGTYSTEIGPMVNGLLSEKLPGVYRHF